MKQRSRLSKLRRHLAVWLGVAGVAVAAAFGSRLANVAPRLLPAERKALAVSADIRGLLLNPLHLPLKASQWLVMRLPVKQTPFLARLPSVLLALLSLALFLYILYRWYGRRSMVLGGAIFLTSAWFLHTGQSAGTEIEFLTATLALLAVHVGLYDHDDSPLMFYGWLLTNIVLLFIPGFAWFILLSLVWQWRVLIIAWRNLVPAWNRALWSVLAVFGITAVALELVRSPGLLRPWLGLPERFAPWQATLRQIGDAFGAFVYRGPHNPEMWLGRLPLLDAFLTAMFVMGLVFYVRHWQAARTRLLGSYLLLGGILVGLHGGVGLSIMVPVVYLVAVGGIAYSLYFWLRRFPRNQLARAVGIVGIVLLVALSCFYNARQYFVAWPHNPETRRLISHP